MLVARLVRKGSKVKIIFADGSFIMVSYEIALESGLRKNEDLSEKRKEELIRQNELFEIKNTAFRLLARRLHSSSELRVKLIQKKFQKNLIEEVIAYLLEKEYLNDIEFAERFAAEKVSFNKIGAAKIRGELIKKGIDRETIDSVLLKYDNDPIVLDNARILAEKKFEYYSRKDLSGRQIRQKLYQFLAGKGFRSDTIL